MTGGGPLKDEVTAIVGQNHIGQLDHSDLINKIKDCLALVFPCLWYEGMPMIIIEAFACGKPVIASNLGAMAEVIANGKTGLVFKPGNARDLAVKINWAIDHPERMQQMEINARKEFEEKYTAEINYKMLMNIFI